MSRIRLYLDEDAMQYGLIAALRAQRVDVLTALDAGMTNESDEEHLARAIRDGRVPYSFNNPKSHGKARQRHPAGRYGPHH